MATMDNFFYNLNLTITISKFKCLQIKNKLNFMDYITKFVLNPSLTVLFPISNVLFTNSMQQQAIIKFITFDSEFQY